MVEQCWWNRVGGTGLVEQGWWNSETVIVDSDSDSGSVWWNTGTVMVEQCGETVMLKQRGGMVEQ